MALKDHITDSAKLSEEEIEGIIADFIKYDPTHRTIVFLPKTQGLSVERKILLHLTALRGWRFVVKDNPPASDAQPREIERVTGVRGGTLRPLLRDLVQSKILESRKGRYEIPAHNLGRVRDAMTTGKSLVMAGRQAVSESPKKKGGATKNGGVKKSSAHKPSLTDAFDKLLQAKWFKGGKTLAQLNDKLKEMAVIVPMSRLPVHLLKACRGENPQLVRNKETINGKQVWVYVPNE